MPNQSHQSKAIWKRLQDYLGKYTQTETTENKKLGAKKIFKEAGYGLSWQVLDASKCGLAAYISEPIHRKA